jgi:asparagine synthase (glutamine-hydrolysing)
MSGIAGIYYLDGRPVERMDVQRMVDSIAHRGPDGSGVWTDGSVGLGHRMLWTTPESLHEKLPLTNKTGDLTITADARIDNRDELIPTLNFNGRPCETIADSELILAAYEKWGDKCPEKLLGDFSFAIWDKRKQTVFCARDHIGVKPFYYYHSNNVFVFASEIKALLSLPEVPRRLNELMVAYYLISTFEDKTITFYKDILRLSPAHTMKMDHKEIGLNQYWSLDPSRELKLGSNDEYAEAFREIFKETVRCRLRSAFPVGSMLSGGLDSSSIVCMARDLYSKNGGGRLHTFSAIFDDVPECDERPFINKVIAQGDFEPHYVPADRLSPLTDLERMFWHIDEALLPPNLFMYWSLYHAAKEAGVRIILDGDDGDTTVSHGIAFLPELARSACWITLFSEIKQLSEHSNKSFWRTLWRDAIKPLAPETIRSIWRNLPSWTKPARTASGIINADFAGRIGLQNQIQALQTSISKPISTERQDHWGRLSSGLIPVILEIVNKAASAFCLEPGYPFFDKRLVEFCLSLPPQQKLNQGWTRSVLRRAMTGILPPEIQWRGIKSDLSPNFTRGFLAFEEDRLKKVILNDTKVIKAYVDMNSLRNTFHRYTVQRKEDDALYIWIATTLALWLEHKGNRL